MTLRGMAKLRREMKTRKSSTRKLAKAARGAATKRSAAKRQPVRTARTAKKAPARKPAPKAARPKAKAAAKVVRKAAAATKPAAKPVKQAAPPPPPPAPAPPPPRKPTYHEAVAMYERGLQALQRRDFAASADALRLVIERYPDERELLERARLYLKVCERELEPKEPAPKTANEWVYAGTVALNAGDEATALKHLQRAVAEDARHDHAHYMMAVISARRGDASGAVDHLRRAVSLNPENRSIARQDPELDSLRGDAVYKSIVDAPVSDTSSRAVAALRPRPKTRR
jgi:tetratricopeptide (TPR) repeat protein